MGRTRGASDSEQVGTPNRGWRDSGIDSVERVSKSPSGEVNEIRTTLGWERVRVQIDSGAIDIVGPEESHVHLR